MLTHLAIKYGEKRGKKMDYKELIERCHTLANRWESGEQLLLSGEMRLQDELRNVATAIETLLAERDAAVRDLTEACEDNPDVCHLCKHLPCMDKDWNGQCLGWQWRGIADSERADKKHERGI